MQGERTYPLTLKDREVVKRVKAIAAERSAAFTSGMNARDPGDEDPTVADFRVNVDGQRDHTRPEIRYVGWANRQPDGTYRALALTDWGLCLVEARIR